MLNWNVLYNMQHERQQDWARAVEQQRRIKEALARQQQPDRLGRGLIWLGGQLLIVGRSLQAWGGYQSMEDTV
jgi:hypothetical protein